MMAMLPYLRSQLDCLGPGLAERLPERPQLLVEHPLVLALLRAVHLKLLLHLLQGRARSSRLLLQLVVGRRPHPLGYIHT